MKGKKASAKKPRRAVERLNKEECQKALLKLAEAQLVSIEKMKKLSSISN